VFLGLGVRATCEPSRSLAFVLGFLQVGLAAYGAANFQLSGIMAIPQLSSCARFGGAAHTTAVNGALDRAGGTRAASESVDLLACAVPYVGW